MVDAASPPRDGMGLKRKPQGRTASPQLQDHATLHRCDKRDACPTFRLPSPAGWLEGRPPCRPSGFCERHRAASHENYLHAFERFILYYPYHNCLLSLSRQPVASATLLILAGGVGWEGALPAGCPPSRGRLDNTVGRERRVTMAAKQNKAISEQLAEWRREQSKRSVDERVDAALVHGTNKDIRHRLGVWGVFLILVGIGTILTWYDVLRDPFVKNSVIPWLLMVWGALTIVLGVADLKSSNPKLLFPTGIATLINGVYLVAGLNMIWGPVMLIVGALMLRDAFKARKQQCGQPEQKTR
jgi:hypothetical protein